MASYSYSGTRNPGKIKAFLVMLVSVLGISLVAFLVGALTGLDPGISVRLMAIFLGPMFLIIAWMAPKVQGDNNRWLNLLLLWITFLALFWPAYIFFSVRGLPSLDPKRLLLILLTLVWLFQVMTSPVLAERFRRRLRLGGVPVLLLLTYMIWRLLSAFASNYPVMALIQLFWEVIYYYMIFFAAITAIRDFSDVRGLVMLLLVGSLVIVGLSGVEYVVGHNLFAKLTPVNAEYAAAQAASLEDKIRAGGYRLQATFDHPMLFAEFLVFMLPIMAFGALKAARPIARMIFLVGMPLMFGAILLSGTRSAISSGGAILFLTLTIFLLRNVQSSKLSLKSFFSVMALLALVSVPLASVTVISQLVEGRNAGERGSSVGRLMQVQLAVPKIQSHPLLGYGVGLGNSELGFKASRGRYSVDNYYLTLALDSGLPGAILFLGSMAAFAWLGVRTFFRDGPEELRFLSGMLGLSVLGVMVVKSVLSVDRNFLFLFLAFAFLVVLKDLMSQAGAAEKERLQ